MIIHDREGVPHDRGSYSCLPCVSARKKICDPDRPPRIRVVKPFEGQLMTHTVEPSTSAVPL